MQGMIAFLSFSLILSLAVIYWGQIGPPRVVAESKEGPSGAEKTPPTASDQSGNEADRKITQQIRQAVTKDDSLSTSAQNVTIVTQDGKVTLRGTVKSESEKQKIAEKTKQVSGVKNVENLITVKQ